MVRKHQSERLARSPASKPGEPQRASGRACAAPERRLLVPYALGQCTDDRADQFEAHLLDCEHCFSDLKCLDRAGSLIRERLDLADNGPTGASERRLSRLAEQIETRDQ